MLLIDHGNKSLFRGMLHILSGSFEPIILLEEYRVVAQPSSISFEDLHIVINFLSYDPRVEAPEWKSKIFLQFVELTQGTRPMASYSGFQMVNSKLLMSLDSFYA
jgi:hypothetical protein